MMRRALLIVAALACLAPGVAASQAPEATRYFVDIRARGGGILGHTFVVYGRTDTRGRVLELHHAGLYPQDAYSESPLLPLLVVPGHVSHAKENSPHEPQIAIYRRRLSAAEYARLQLTVRQLQGMRPAWNFLFYNCNDFVADIAHSVGLRTPPGLQPPEDFVRGIAMLNRHNRPSVPRD
jgi:hypothetical protein